MRMAHLLQQWNVYIQHGVLITLPQGWEDLIQQCFKHWAIVDQHSMSLHYQVNYLQRFQKAHICQDCTKRCKHRSDLKWSHSLGSVGVSLRCLCLWQNADECAVYVFQAQVLSWVLSLVCRISCGDIGHLIGKDVWVWQLLQLSLSWRYRKGNVQQVSFEHVPQVTCINQSME